MRSIFITFFWTLAFASLDIPTRENELWLKPVHRTVFQTYKDPATQELIKPWVSSTRLHTEQSLLLWLSSFSDSICWFFAHAGHTDRICSLTLRTSCFSATASQFRLMKNLPRAADMLQVMCSNSSGIMLWMSKAACLGESVIITYHAGITRIWVTVQRLLKGNSAIFLPGGFSHNYGCSDCGQNLHLLLALTWESTANLPKLLNGSSAGVTLNWVCSEKALKGFLKFWM